MDGWYKIMMNHALKWCFISGLLLLLNACESRDVLAPVVESNWKAMNNHAKQHVVVRGETLYAVAFRYDQDYRQLADANHLTSPYTLRVGQVINLQPGNQPVTIALPRRVQKISDVRPALPSTPQPIISRSQAQYGAWSWPVRGDVVTHFVPQEGKKGINIAGHKGEKIHAAAAGTVAYAGSGLAGYGNLIIIKHNNQYLTAYGNNLHNLVKEGQRIHAGQTIADMGIVDRRYWGVHFEIRKSGKPVNPLSYLQK